jgi:hypothetical protein
MGYTKFGGLWNKNVGDVVLDAALESFEDSEVEGYMNDSGSVGSYLTCSRACSWHR